MAPPQPIDALGRSCAARNRRCTARLLTSKPSIDGQPDADDRTRDFLPCAGERIAHAMTTLHANRRFVDGDDVTVG